MVQCGNNFVPFTVVTFQTHVPRRISKVSSLYIMAVMILLQNYVSFLSVPSLCQFVHVIDRKASAPARVALNVAHLSGQKSATITS